MTIKIQTTITENHKRVEIRQEVLKATKGEDERVFIFNIVYDTDFIKGLGELINQLNVIRDIEMNTLCSNSSIKDTTYKPKGKMEAKK